MQRFSAGSWGISLALLVVIVLLAACNSSSPLISPLDGGGSHSTTPALNNGLPSQPPPSSAMAGIPTPPHDAYVDPAVIRARRANAVGTVGLLGSQAVGMDQANASVDPADHTCVLSPGPGTLSWAMYAFSDLLPEDLPLTLSLRPLGETPPSPCYVALPDFARGAWDWTVLNVSQQEYSIPVGTGAGALSPGGSLYVVVATYDGVAMGIGGLNLQLDCPAPPPVGFDAEGGDGQAVPVHLSWVDPAVSFDPDGAGPEQFVYDGVQIQRAESPDGPWVDLQPVPPGTTEVDDPGSLGNPPPDGAYYYHLMTLVSGATLLWGVVIPGGVNFALNQLVAKFTITPPAGQTYIRFDFDAGTSIHTGGALKSVQWDFDGNGTWDATAVAWLLVSHYYAAPGRYYPKLKLVMDLGGGSTMTDYATGYVAVGEFRGDWNQIGRNEQHSGLSPMVGPTAATLRGSYTAGGTFVGVAVGAGIPGYCDIYAACADGTLYGLTRGCALIRKITLPGQAASAPAVDAKGCCWVIYRDGLFNIRLASVRADFSVHPMPPGMVTGAPVVTRDGLYAIIPAANVVYCAFSDIGGPKWYSWYYALPTGDSASTPAIDNSGNVYIASESGLYKLNSAGILQWKKTSISNPVQNPAVAPDGKVYVPIRDGGILHAFDSTGAVLGAVGPVAGQIVGAPAFGPDGNVYFSTSAGQVWCYTPAPGLVQIYPPYDNPSVQFVSAPVIDGDGFLYLLTADGRMLSLTRKLFFRYSYPLGSTATACNLAIGNDGTLYAGGTKKLVGLK
jgi:hypothetical protein